MIGSLTFNHSARRAMHGMSLLFALLALVALSLAGAALVRSVSTGSQVIGNLGFKQDATGAAGRATEAAIEWIKGNPTALTANNPAAGYYATSLDALDPTGQTSTTGNPKGLVDWDSNDCAYAAGGDCNLSPSGAEYEVNGNKSRYLISRLCQKAEAMSATNICARPASATPSSAVDRGGIDGNNSQRLNESEITPYYRIIVRTLGARNTTSFTETIVHF